MFYKTLRMQVSTQVGLAVVVSNVLEIMPL